MTSPLPISVHLLTHHSAATLEAALQSLPLCREIIVADGGSTDGTLEIAQRYKALIIPQPSAALDATGKILDFSRVRNAALAHSTQPWILTLDSDETLSPELRADVERIAGGDGKPAACLVPRRYLRQDGQVIRLATTYPNERIYFFHRESVESWIKPVHERVKTRPGFPLLRCSGWTLAALPTLEEYKLKNRQYIAIEAALSRDKGWSHWFRHRLLHTLRSRMIATVRLFGIWLLPRKGPRLPLRHELLRYWYAWRLLAETCPLHRR